MPEETSAAALARVRADITYDPHGDSTQFVLEYLAEHDTGVGGELARELFAARDALDEDALDAEATRERLDSEAEEAYVRDTDDDA